MKRRAGFLLQGLILVLSVCAHGGATAAVIAYDGFRLSLPLYGASGTGFNGPWTFSGPLFEVGEPSLCHPGLRTSGFSVTPSAEGAILGRTLAVPFGAPGTTAYVSFLLQPLASESGYGFSGLSLNGHLFVGKPGNGVVGNYVVETYGGAGQVATDVPVVVGTTTLIVLKIQFSAGVDMITMYANPVPGTAEPASGVVKADIDLGSVTGLSLVSVGAPFAFDEIRVGTTYADVVPFDDKRKCK